MEASLNSYVKRSFHICGWAGKQASIPVSTDFLYLIMQQCYILSTIKSKLELNQDVFVVAMMQTFA